jgi:hypothetical protein
MEEKNNVGAVDTAEVKVKAPRVTKTPDGQPIEKKPKAPAGPKHSILKNVAGDEVPEEDYFFNGKIPPGFAATCGKPVDREDLITVFNKIFKPTDNILFYKAFDKEVYIVIIPIKYSTTVGEDHSSVDGDFQKHAISFLTEGSVNMDTLTLKLKRIIPFVKYSDR